MPIVYFNKDYLPYLFRQRTRLTTEYALNEQSDPQAICSALNTMTDRDYETIATYLPEKAQHILDIGCGLATIDLKLADKYPEAHYWLLDKSEMVEKSPRGFHEKYFFYNSMDLVGEFLCGNGMKEEAIHLIEDTLEPLYGRQYEVILSLLSCGWHYPLETYLWFIKSHLAEGGVLVIDVRCNPLQESILYGVFRSIEKIYNEAESKKEGGVVGYRYACRN